MIKAEEDLKILEQKRNQEIKRAIASIKNEYELARTQESVLRQTLAWH